MQCRGWHSGCQQWLSNTVTTDPRPQPQCVALKSCIKKTEMPNDTIVTFNVECTYMYNVCQLKGIQY